jgi:uncharacterized membrane protein YqgA involved in biofilm formation
MSHNLKIIIGGIVLFGLFYAAGRKIPLTGRTTVLSFLCLWILVLGINLWFGVSKAGYSFAEELRIALLDFFLVGLLASAIAWLTRWS